MAIAALHIVIVFVGAPAYIRLGLITIGAIYTLRGFAVFAQARYLIEHGMSLLRRELVFSAVSLIVGIIYLSGTLLSWHLLGKRQQTSSEGGI